MNVELYDIIYKKLCIQPFVFCFTKINLKDVNNINDKYRKINAIMNNMFFNDDCFNTLLNDLYLSNKVYFGFLKLYKILALKKSNTTYYNNDLMYNSLDSISESCKIQIVEDYTYFNFKITDLINIINNSLTNNNATLVSSNPIKNPYTNKKFSKSTLFYIYLKIKFSNFIIPTLFQLYFNCFFDDRIFLKRYSYMINDYNVNNHIKTLNNNEFFKKIRYMIKKKNKSLNMNIYIDDDFPKEILIDCFKSYYELYYCYKYSFNEQISYTSNNLLNTKLLIFYIKFPSFGRKKIKIKNQRVSDTYFEKDYLPYSEIKYNILSEPDKIKYKELNNNIIFDNSINNNYYQDYYDYDESITLLNEDDEDDNNENYDYSDDHYDYDDY